MPVFKIHHITKYEYDRPVRESANEIKIYPYSSPLQETLSHEIAITGQPDILVFHDYWNNKTGVFNLLPLHKELIVESRLVLRTTGPSEAAINFDGSIDSLQHETEGNIKLIELAEASFIKNTSAINDIIKIITANTTSVAAIAQNCSEYIYKNFRYTKGITNVETTVDDILEHNGGVCQDFAHLMLQVLRTLKIPSRYVSGYICPNKKGIRGEGATHAWVEVLIPSYGWAGIDPTNNIWVTNNHVKLAIGRHFNDCTPIKGTFKGPAHQKLSVYVSIGYEDGRMFEEINNVNMQEYEPEAKEELVDESFAAQQQ
ncbi:transglutaminase family protein [Parafilimonas sp.]|uniref:transglutaminase family protein n=1 Tax=Parafilimonas sp. TaxID=1969739 RepID=UPI0039E23C41